MKKLISCLLAVMLFASLSAVPAFAAAVNLEEPVFSCDFEDFDATDDKFFDAEKPAGFPFFVGGSEGGGLQIVENGVGGTNSVTYFRAADTSESTNIRQTWTLPHILRRRNMLRCNLRFGLRSLEITALPRQSGAQGRMLNPGHRISWL